MLLNADTRQRSSEQQRTDPRNVAPIERRVPSRRSPSQPAPSEFHTALSGARHSVHVSKPLTITTSAPATTSFRVARANPLYRKTNGPTMSQMPQSSWNPRTGSCADLGHNPPRRRNEQHAHGEVVRGSDPVRRECPEHGRRREQPDAQDEIDVGDALPTSLLDISKE